MRPGHVRPAGLSHSPHPAERHYPDTAVASLACPHCGNGLRTGDGSFECPAGHVFDIAKQGYVALLGPRARTDTGDSPQMVAARVAFLGAGHYEALAAAVVDAAAGADRARSPTTSGPVLEIGAGSAYYLRATLDAGRSASGVAVDSSRCAARRAAADPRIVSVVADAWSPLPMRTSGVAVVLSVFAPRNPSEIARVMAVGATFIAVTPEPPHLLELRDKLGMLHIDDGKAERLGDAFEGLLRPLDRRTVTFGMQLVHDDVAALVAMGPSARHVGALDLADRIAALPATVEVTVAVTVSVFVKV